MNLKNKIYDIVFHALEKAVKEGDLPELKYPVIKIEYAKDDKFGDYSTSIAMESAKLVRRSPLEIGEIIKKYIAEDNFISKVDIVKPGFINLFLTLNCIYDNLSVISDKNSEYGRTVKENPDKINLEFVSANPTGPMNIVSARAASLGDTIANLLQASGNIVEKEFYINDFGNQVLNLGLSILARIKELNGEEVEFPEDGYQGEYIIEIAREINDNFRNEIDSFDDESKLIEFLATKGIEKNVGGQKEDLTNFNVSFDKWFREKTLHENGKVEEAFEYLKEHNHTFEEDGKIFFKSTAFGDDKDRVIIRDDGRPTYLLADIAYHKDKIDRNYDKIIDIWGPDHHGYIARLAGAVEAMGYEKEKFKVLISQQVNLLMDGQTVKMSKRLGKFSTMKDLVHEIGVDVARYFFIMRSLDSHLDFDLVLAKKQSSENPVFYLQYAHARICSIFKKAAEKNIEYDRSKAESSFLNNTESILIMKHLIKFTSEIYDSAENYEPHRIANYLLKLAQLFHRFYTEHIILSDNIEMSNSFLFLSDSVRIVLKNGLLLLGLNAPEKM